MTFSAWILVALLVALLATEVNEWNRRVGDGSRWRWKDRQSTNSIRVSRQGRAQGSRLHGECATVEVVLTPNPRSGSCVGRGSSIWGSRPRVPSPGQACRVVCSTY
jgi:hypothetical protein